MAIFSKHTKESAIKYLEGIFSRDRRAIIKQVSVKRTTTQNNLYWMWLACIEKETGNDKDALHDYFREEYLEVKYTKIYEKEIKILKSTTELDTKHMTEYMDKIHREMSEEGIYLPLPEDQYLSEFIEQYKDDEE